MQKTKSDPILKRKVRIRLKTKTGSQGRRSIRRLGRKPVVMESTLPRATHITRPATSFWKTRGSRLVGMAGLIMIGWILYLLFELDDFYIYQANITGNQALSAAEIYAAADIHTQSVFWTQPADVEARIEALPNIKAAHVSITLPANVSIVVEERLPEVVWQTGDQIWWIDSEGTFVPPRDDAGVEAKRLLIVDTDNRPVALNDRIDPAIIRSAQLIRQQKPEIESLLYSQIFGLVFTTPEGWPVYVGKTNQIPAKLLVAESVRQDLLARQVVPLFIDVRNPLRAVYRAQE
jgi:cell division septal protein FtsQ